MLTKMLSDFDKNYLIELANLLAIADKPILWDGKTLDELTSETDLSKISIQKGSIESELIEEMSGSSLIVEPVKQQKYSVIGAMAGMFKGSPETRFLEKMKRIPVHKTEDPALRLEAAASVMREIMEGRKFDLPSVPKLILFELMLLALSNGVVTGIEWSLLKEVQHYYQFDDFIFDDLMERAKTMNVEMAKTISIILE